jgi:hypothetical protein
MPKIVVNACYGGFGLSHAAIMRYSELAGLRLQATKGSSFGFEYYTYYVDGIIDDDHVWYCGDLERTDPYLVQVVEELGKSAAGTFASLRIADVPNDVEWYINDYDGIETVCEKHRKW